MSDSSFGAFVPGFDFLQGLVKNAGAAIPGFNQWVAPTLNPQELEKRINELRAVQFWLEQNARMLATTVQALEVQKMTLSTLSAMNVPMADLKQALKTPPMPDFGAAMAGAQAAARAAGWPGTGAPAQSAASGTASGGGKPASPSAGLRSDDADPPEAPAAKAAAEPPADKGAKDSPDAHQKAAPIGVDPMQWWNALTQQFTQIATQAMKDNSLVKQGLDAAGETFRKAAAMPGEMMTKAAQAATASAPGRPAAAASSATPARKSTAAPKTSGGAATRPAGKAPAKTAGKTAKPAKAATAAQSASTAKAGTAAAKTPRTAPSRRTP